MAKADKNAAHPAGQRITLNPDLCGLNGEAHPHAGRTATILSKQGKSWVAEVDEIEGVCVLHAGDFSAAATAQPAQHLHAAGIKSEIVSAELSRLRESPFNPRTRYDEAALAELSATIATVGIMQPLLVRPVSITADGVTVEWLEIVFGHRRFRAAAMAGFREVPVMVRSLTDAQSAALQAIENLQREDLDPIDEAKGYADFIASSRLTKQQAAEQLGKSRTSVYNRLKLLQLCPAGQELVRRKALDAELAIEVARADGTEKQTEILQGLFYGADLTAATAETKSMSWRQGRALIEKMQAPATPTPTTNAKPAPKIADVRTLYMRATHSLGLISRALGIPDEVAASDGGNDAILAKIRSLQAQAKQ